MGWHGLRRCRTVGSLIVAASLTTGCIGATDRADFDAEVRRRGGGVSTAWIDDALEVAAAEFDATGADGLEVLTMSISPAVRSITIQARRADRPDFVDTVVVVEGEVRSVQPMQDADDLPLDELVIPLAALPLDRIEELTDAAITELGEPDGFVTTITVDIVDSVHRIRMRVESARQTATVVFDVDGEVIEVRA